MFISFVFIFVSSFSFSTFAADDIDKDCKLRAKFLVFSKLDSAMRSHKISTSYACQGLESLGSMITSDYSSRMKMCKLLAKIKDEKLKKETYDKSLMVDVPTEGQGDQESEKKIFTLNEVVDKYSQQVSIEDKCLLPILNEATTDIISKIDFLKSLEEICYDYEKYRQDIELNFNGKCP